MKKEITVPAYIFKPKFSEKMITTEIKRQDDILKIHFPVFEKNEVLDIAQKLKLRKRKAHDRPIDEIISIMDSVGALWLDKSYDVRKEALEIVSMITGQSQRLCEMELDLTLKLWQKSTLESYLLKEIGGKEYLDRWVSRGALRLHAQPRGLVLHNMAGNVFNLGMVSLFDGMLTKNVNLIKIPREEPYFSVKFAESIAEIDKKIAKELAVLYWKGSQSEIYDELFNSGLIDCVIAWGGLQSIEDIRRRANRFGIQIIDHGPKLSFTMISEDILRKPNDMIEYANKIGIDIAFWNQKACLSPRVIYIAEKPRISSINNKDRNSKNIDESDLSNDLLNTISKRMSKNLNGQKKSSNKALTDYSSLMKRSIKMLKNEITDTSPLGFARLLAIGMEKANKIFPRTHMTQSDGMQTLKKREYFSMKYEFNQMGEIIIPKNGSMDWTVVYLRNPPSIQEINMCTDRFIVVTRIADINHLVNFMKKEKLNQYLQTFSIYGSDPFVESVAEEFSLIGANRFMRVGEHNYQNVGAPWDGHFVLNEMVKWVYIGFLPGEGIHFQNKQEPNTIEFNIK